MKFLIVLAAFCFVVVTPEISQRICGGEYDKIKEFPYQVSVRIYDHHHCGGSILDETTILTVANCIYRFTAKQVSVRVGNTIHKYGNRFYVNKIIIHNLYNPLDRKYDLAILKLNSTLKFNNSVQPIELQPAGLEVQAETVANVSGWGIIKRGEYYNSDELVVASVDVITNKDCNKKYAGQASVSSKMLCAFALRKNVCEGDYGGPLVVNGTLIGVASWGLGCVHVDYPGVYTKISTFHNWIANYI